jgi:hypothetical protein
MTLVIGPGPVPVIDAVADAPVPLPPVKVTVGLHAVVVLKPAPPVLIITKYIAPELTMFGVADAPLPPPPPVKVTVGGAVLGYRPGL